MKKPADIAAYRTKERTRLLEQLTDQLKQDDRVRAAWISGSIARGNDDWLSDIDLYVVISEASIKNVVSSRHDFAALATRSILSMDMMTNASPKGAYLLVHYPGKYGPQHVDWFWQPESMAKLPDDGMLLFDEAGLPLVDGAIWAKEMHQPENGPPIDDTALSAILTNKIEYFWAMSFIVAKYIARRDSDTVERMTNVISRTFNEISESLNVVNSTYAVPGIVPGADMAIQFQVLRRLTGQAVELHGNIVRHGAAVPTEAVTQIRRFFEVCESVSLRS